MEQVVFSLGSNLGNRDFYLKEAIKCIEERIGSIVKKSHVYETDPWGTSYPNKFLNMVLIVNTNLEPAKILNNTQFIEKKLGRKCDEERNSPRTIDIDILFYGNMVLDIEQLTIPHPRIAERNFVLAPLTEVYGSYVHPVLKKTIKELFAESEDKMKVLRIVKE